MKKILLLILLVSSFLAKSQTGTEAKYWAFMQAGKVYNVQDIKYGAKGDSTTDDRAAIQAAINAADAAGGGVVYFPNAIYNLGTAKDATSGAQLYVPLHSGFSPHDAPHIILMGEVAPNFISDPITSEGPPSSKGVVLKSNYTGAVDIIGSTSATGPYGPMNFTHITLMNLTIRANSRSGGSNIAPTATAVNASLLAYLTMQDCQLDCETDFTQIVTPVTTSIGIITPNVGNFAIIDLKRIWIAGFYYGIKVNEHTYMDNVSIDACMVGLDYLASNHASYGSRVLIQRTAYTIRIEATCKLILNDLDIEANASGSRYWNYIATIDEGTVTGSEGTIKWTTSTGTPFIRNTALTSKIIDIELDGNLPKWTDASRPKLLSRPGQMVGYNTARKILEFNNGTAWVDGAAATLTRTTYDLTASPRYVAYSLHKIVAGYAGSAVQVRRSSDNTTSDIGFTGSGFFDTATYKTFVGAGNGFVAKWYDQSGNAHDLVQATNGSQPQIDLTTYIPSIKVFNTFLQYASGSGQAQPFKAYVIVNNAIINAGGNSDFMSGSVSGDCELGALQTTNYAELYGGTTTITPSTRMQNSYIFIGEFNAASSVGTLNGVTFSGSPGSAGFRGVTIGKYAGAGGGAQFNIYEAVIFSDNTVNAATITTTLNSFYYMF